MKYLFILFAFVLLPFRIFAQQDSSLSTFLNFSDIHFDPYHDTTLIKVLINSESSEWEQIFANAADQSYSEFGSDSNFPLFRSLLEDMHSRIPDPDFILITGDFMAHNFNENYFKYSGSHNSDSLKIFIEKTMKFITHMITKFYPSSLIFPIVGNDDAYCGNYMVDPGGEFLKMLSELWSPLIIKNGQDSLFKKTFAQGGYCEVKFPGAEKYRMIIMNSVFFSYKYDNQCGDTLSDPGKEELVWLENILRKYSEEGNKVWLSMHIPPGVDIFGTINGKGNCYEKILSTWKKTYNEDFLKIIIKYSDVINASFAGHFHRDDFRVVLDKGIPVSYFLLTSSLSPVYGNNPSYRIVKYDKSNFMLSDYQTYYLNDKSTERSDWIAGYSFTNAYDQRNISAKTLSNASDEIFSDSTYRAGYIKFYTANNTSSYEKDYSNWMYNWCGMKNLSKEEFDKCMCEGK